MSRPRKPIEALDPSAFKRNPNRKRASGPKSGNPIGEAPVHLTELEGDCWRELVRIVPKGVLQEENRPFVELTARLLAQTRIPFDLDKTFDKLSTARLALLKECLVQIGLTPAARSKVSSAPEDENEVSPYTRFLKQVR